MAQVDDCKIAYIGCWFNRDMYSHNCSNLIDSLRRRGANVNVVTSNCRCFSSAHQFDISTDELINGNCTLVKIPHAPANPGKRKHGLLKYAVVKFLRLDIWLGAVRGYLYYKNSRSSEIVHYDQVLEAFGVIPLYVLAALRAIEGKRLFVTVHEIDPFQRKHLWVNELYRKCTGVIVYSENMKRALADLGIDPNRMTVTRYGTVVLDLVGKKREGYIYFGGHNILNGKGYPELLGALKILQSRGVQTKVVVYVGHGCNRLDDARAMATNLGLDEMIEWNKFLTGSELAAAYQRAKACIVPYTSGSARHPLTTAMSNATAVIGTRYVDIPEYLGPLGIYIDGTSESIADTICKIQDGSVEINRLGIELRKKSIAEMHVDKVAEDLFRVFSLDSQAPQQKS